MELNSARKLHRTEEDDDEAVYDTSEWTFHVYNYPPVAEPDLFTISSSVPVKVVDVQAAATDPPSNTVETSPATNADTAPTVATQDPPLVAPSVPSTPQAVSKHSKKGKDTSPERKSSDLSMEENTTDDEENCASSVPHTKIVPPSSPDKGASPSAASPRKFSDIGHLTDMDVDSPGQSTDDLPDMLEKLTTTCTFYICFILPHVLLILHLQRFNLRVIWQCSPPLELHVSISLILYSNLSNYAYVFSR